MPALFLIIPLIGVIILNLPGKKAGNAIAMWVALICILLQIFLSLTVGASIWEGLKQTVSLGYQGALSIDYMSLTALFTIGLISFITLLVGWKTIYRNRFSFVNLLLLITIGMNGVAMVTDFFSMYVFLEVTAVASFVLIALYRDSNGLEGAFKYLVMSAAATALMLCAIAFVYMAVGTLSFTAVRAFVTASSGGLPLQVIIGLVLFTAGLSVKAGLAPFHGWVPDAYSAAPNAVSVLLGGIVTKMAGVYTLMRLTISVFGTITPVLVSLLAFGLISIVMGAVAAIGQRDFKRMLAYSSISQLGYIILGVAVGTPLGILGAAFHFFNHAIFKSCLFVNSAAVELQTGTRNLNKLGGLAAKMPITGVSSILAFLSTAGIPPLAGFWSKLLIIMAVYLAGFPIIAAIALLSSILTLAYFLILQRKVFFGKVAHGLEKVEESRGGIAWSEIILSAITVGMGVFFPFVLLYLQSQALI